MQNSNIRPDKDGVEIIVRGTVQGVGFRPFIYNLASRFEISGTVANTSDGVVIMAAAAGDRLDAFVKAINEEAPVLARITSLDSKPTPVDTEEGVFTILPSTGGVTAKAAIPPDIALCDDCRRELLDPADRRYHYPFTNCTNCGPRLTIVETIPYDRPMTSMKDFPMCEACRKEYHDPTNRRFHAQPNACPDCGPQIFLHGPEDDPRTADTCLQQTATALKNGQVVAMRGLGGFHLVVNGSSIEAVKSLRQRKGRPDKPLAIMVADSAQAKKFCYISKEEELLLHSAQHPIVLLKQRDNNLLAENLAPGIAEIGMMLPYTPLHQMLFEQRDCPEVLVMTSGNVSGSPICTDNDDALTRLGPFTDLFLFHDREIVTRVDDSVVKSIANRTIMFRRARGYVPTPLNVAMRLPKILACGAGLKNSFSLGRDHEVLVSQHIGDLDSLEVYDFFLESVAHLKSVFQLEPEAVVCDLHPDYLSSRYAVELGLPLYKVQHHHAHAVAVMAEHHLKDPVISIVLDGTGLGDDGTSWGGEILQTDLTSYKRLGHLTCLHLPGGDAAAVEPWRMALSGLFSCYGVEGFGQNRLPATLAHLESSDLTVISSMLTNEFNSPLTSSCGRLFDCIAALLGVRQTISYEGQAAMELEALAKTRQTSTWKEEILTRSVMETSAMLEEDNDLHRIRSDEIIKAVLDGIKRNDDPAELALQFHTMLITSITRLIEILSKQTGIRQIVLSGGCMQNSLLLEGLFHTLQGLNVQIFTGNSLPLNDGAISFGQTIIGGLRHVSRNSNESN
ncbi:MAG: carbamoyltransferase HypF [Desulforhopalus sp.]